MYIIEYVYNYNRMYVSYMFFQAEPVNEIQRDSLKSWYLKHKEKNSFYG